LLELLQGRGLVTGPEVARRLEVDPRTVRRYVAALEELGIPVESERGRDGGYRLVAGFKLPPMMFTEEEALALSVGLLAARGLGLGEAAPAVASAQAKLQRVMPAALQRRVRDVDETVALDLAQPATPAPAGVLAALSDAARRRRRVHLAARAADGTLTERDFDPWGLAYRRGRWYAVGWCHLRRSQRTFRLDRLERVETADGAFERPAGFDALQSLSEGVARLPRANSAEVWLAADLSSARRAIYPALGVLEASGRGVLLRAQADDLGWLAGELARLPMDFEVRSPPALRDALEVLAARVRRGARAQGTVRRGRGTIEPRQGERPAREGRTAPLGLRAAGVDPAAPAHFSCATKTPSQPAGGGAARCLLHREASTSPGRSRGTSPSSPSASSKRRSR
jgi:predicted DNA-binding transcriptional regulator YafY